MFAVLQFSDKNTVFRKPEIKSQRITLPSGGVFFIVSTHLYRGKILWKHLERCLGVLGKCLILPEGITIPEGVNLREFSSDIFPRLLLMNSAVDYISKHKGKFCGESLTIYDGQGIYTGYIEKLSAFFRSIKIVTSFSREYEKISQKLMDSYGFSLLVTEKRFCQNGTVISYEGDVPLYFKGTLFTSEKKQLLSGASFYGTEISLPQQYSELCPDNIDKLIFASALYEKSGAEELSLMKYTDFGS